MPRKVLALVDIQQLFLSSREEYGPLARVDYVKLKKLFPSNPDDYVYACCYILCSPYHDERKFVKFLKNNNYYVFRRFPNLMKDSTKNEPKVTWSDEMVWEGLTALSKYDEVVIVSGNGAFCSVVNAAHHANKKVRVVSFRSSLQTELARIADSVTFLNEEYIFDSNVHKGQPNIEVSTDGEVVVP